MPVTANITPMEIAHFRFALIAPAMDALLPKPRSDKSTTRTLDDVLIEEIYRLREKYPRINATMIHTMLIQDGYIPATVSNRAVQRFIKANDLKSARNPNVKDLPHHDD